AEQQSIAELPDVKVRLGNLNANNQQKGVDSLIRSDLESLARHRAISDAALLGGDEDLVSAVEAAQGYGARVHLWGIEAPEGRNQAEPLLWEVDSQRTLDLDFFKPYVSRRAALPYEATATRPTREDVRFVGAQIAAKWLAARGRDALVELLPGHPYLPGSVDQDLLVEAEGLLQYSLRGQADLRRALRDGFWEHLQTQY
ncbi:NYN domain-containing protein, partial [Streptomyces sp. NPDC058855]